jgi:hypothetical protein
MHKRTTKNDDQFTVRNCTVLILLIVQLFRAQLSVLLIHLVVPFVDGLGHSPVKEQAVFVGELLLSIQTVREIYTTDATICMNLNTQGFNVTRPVSTLRKIRQIKLDLVPSLVQPERHRANERLNSSRAQVIGSTEASSNTLVVEHLDFEREVLSQLRVK